MKKTILTMMAAATLVACSNKQKANDKTANSENENPFLTEWNTPYGIPPYDKIGVDDYIPALKAGIEQDNKDIETIVNNPDAPTFENTIEPLEQTGSIIAKVSGVLYNITETDRTDALDSIMEIATPLLSEHSDNISFNKALYDRIAAIYNADQSQLTREQQMALKKHYENFKRNGVGLSDEKQERLKQINAEEASKAMKISQNILDESNAFKEKFGISVSDYPNAMTSTEDRSLREEMLKAYTMRCHNGNKSDNTQLILEVMKLRIEKAQLMGYKSPADYILEDKMAHDPKTVDAFLNDIIKASVAKAKEEVAEMQKIMDKDIAEGKLPEGSKIEAWDWWYYSEKVRKEKYDLDESQIKPYFKLDNVVKGVFLAAHKLYGINMEELSGMPAYNKENVKTYKVTDEKGELLGIFTTDYLPRDSKRGGAWMNNVRDQYVDAQGNVVRPIICNVANLEEYLNIDEVQTVFHEFGHALHGLLTKCNYRSVSGTNVAHDFVEVFSQINENWAFQPALLTEYAKNAKGEVIPTELVEKINNSLKFNQGFMTTELCAAAILDMKWHELSSIDGIDIDKFEEKITREIGLIPEIGYRYRTTYFNHIMGGYGAGYYGYLWAEVLDKDAFSEFEKSGDVFNKELSTKFKQTFLERGGTEEPMVLFQQFTGRKPNNEAFLIGRGLK